MIGIKAARRWLASLCLVVVAGCATLPDNTDRPVSYRLTDPVDSPLAQLADQNSSGKSGFVLLSDGLDAFVARALLANQAQHTIDVQYYLWHDDLVGRSLAGLLLQAADRGVRIRMLIDDIDTHGKDWGLTALAMHPNLSVRVINPFSRQTLRASQYLSRFGKVTRRMHNKSFTADNRATVIGGRNIGNEYFEADPKVTFGDLDTLAVGPIVDQVSESFDDYWNSSLAYPIDTLAKRRPNQQQAEDLWQRLRDFMQANSQSPYATALRELPLVDQFAGNTLPFRWGSASLLVDDPSKLTEDRSRVDLQMSQDITPLFAEATNEVIIFSPYFIPGKEGTAGLVALAERGVRVRVLTNSLASNNHSIVHSHYAKYRKPLLRAGVELHETRGKQLEPEIKAPFGTSGSTVLHAKSFVIDRQKVFIGSLNFDKRSFVENTEIGVVIESSELAAEMGTWFDQQVDKAAYRVALADGRRVVWQDRGTADHRVIYKEPETTAWERFKMRLMALVPAESQL